MSKKGYYEVKPREEWRLVDYIEIFDSDSGEISNEQEVLLSIAFRKCAGEQFM